MASADEVKTNPCDLAGVLWTQRIPSNGHRQMLWTPCKKTTDEKRKIKKNVTCIRTVIQVLKTRQSSLTQKCDVSIMFLAKMNTEHCGGLGCCCVQATLEKDGELIV